MNQALTVAALVLALGIAAPAPAHADGYTWALPGIGSVSIPLTTGNTLIAGYDIILKSAVEGASTRVGTIFTGTKEQLDLNLGAVNAWHVPGSPVQPFLSLSHDVRSNLPFLTQYTDLQVHLFARYDTNLGKIGGGVAAGYTPTCINPAPASPTAYAPELGPKLALLR